MKNKYWTCGVYGNNPASKILFQQKMIKARFVSDTIGLSVFNGTLPSVFCSSLKVNVEQWRVQFFKTDMSRKEALNEQVFTFYNHEGDICYISGFYYSMEPCIFYTVFPKRIGHGQYEAMKESDIKSGTIRETLNFEQVVALLDYVEAEIETLAKNAQIL